MAEIRVDGLQEATAQPTARPTDKLAAIDEAITKASEAMLLNPLKPKQLEAIRTFMSGSVSSDWLRWFMLFFHLHLIFFLVCSVSCQLSPWTFLRERACIYNISWTSGLITWFFSHSRCLSKKFRQVALVVYLLWLKKSYTVENRLSSPCTYYHLAI